MTLLNRELVSRVKYCLVSAFTDIVSTLALLVGSFDL